MATTPSSAITDALKDRTSIQTDTYAEILRLLGLAQEQIAAILAAAPTDYQSWSLPQLSAAIEQALAEFSAAGSAALGSSAGTIWNAGQELVDLPIQLSGIQIGSVMPVVDTRQLVAMRSFMTGRIKDIGLSTANNINSQLGLVVIGAQSPGDAMAYVRSVLDGTAKSRARTIVRTELNRVFSVSGAARMSQAEDAGVVMEKTWRRSGKVHSRAGHDAAHGQTVPVKSKFKILGADGQTYLMMHPHDPEAPAAETINCGCVAVPKIKGWNSQVQLPATGQWSNQALRARAKQFADANGLSPGKGVPAKSTMETFVASSRINQGQSRWMNIGEVERWRKIRNATQVDLKGYATLLDSSTVNHILRQHGNESIEAARGQRAVTARDIALIPEILSGFDQVMLSARKTNWDTLNVLQFEKEIDGESYVYLAEVRTGRRKLAGTTMYIKRKK